MKKSIRSEITRGISAGMSYNEIARNISKATKAPLSRAKTVVYTEGHRVQQASNYDGQRKAKSKGADVVKQWSSILDGNTRPTHRKLDGQIKEVEEPFEMDGKKAMYPGEFGDPAEDCNCRCVSMTRARWALDEEELQTLKDRAEYFGLDKSENFADFKKKYLQSLENAGENGIISIELKALPERFKDFLPKSQERRLEIIEKGKSLEKPIFADDLLGDLAPKIEPHENYYDVVMHGYEYGVQFFGENIDVETLCAIIAQRKDYTKGTPIRLISCFTGAQKDVVASYIAEKLHVTVLAPNKKAIVTRKLNGKTVVYSGSEIGIRDGDFVAYGKEGV